MIDLIIGVVIAGIALEDAAVKFKSGGDRNGWPSSDSMSEYSLSLFFFFFFCLR